MRGREPRMAWKTVCLSLVICFSLLIYSPGVRESLASPPGKTGGKAIDFSKYERIDLGQIRQNPEKFQHRKLLVTGIFLGWQGKGKHPGITRSDWVVEDASGALYVAGAPPFGLDPVKDRGRPITLWGTLEITGKGIPYLVPDKIEIGERK